MTKSYSDGRKRKKRKQKQHHQSSSFKKSKHDTSSLASASLTVLPSKSAAASASQAVPITSLPLPFPFQKNPKKKKLPVPLNDFLRNVHPYQQSFQTALQTSYEGFATDIDSHMDNSHSNPHKNPNPTSASTSKGKFEHEPIQSALQRMHTLHHLFRTDVTQPFGLGTKCAKTYVTRCLLGDDGCTYKYLGLRMFAHPWNWNWNWNGRKNVNDSRKNGGSDSDSGSGSGSDADENDEGLKEALQTIYQLNQTLTQRTTEHLHALSQTRQERHMQQNQQMQMQKEMDDSSTRGAYTYTNGRSGYDIALINRMTTHDFPHLKAEPLVTNAKNNHRNSNTNNKKKRKGSGKGGGRSHGNGNGIDGTDGTDEPRSAVSWHADSSLEHYSSIAVYQTVVADENEAGDGDEDEDEEKKRNQIRTRIQKENEIASKWSIALRVAHNAEGPMASKRKDVSAREEKGDGDGGRDGRGDGGRDGRGSGTREGGDGEDGTAPAIAVSLPSRSAYYLLDDFNHHHQHTVLLNHTSKSHGHGHGHGVRYASTHRLLRESHNVHYILERCRSTVAQFHKKGGKVWRSEQLLLMEVESEWIRQFYVQGVGHKENLWKYWKAHVCQLLHYWGQLEQRTKQVVDILRYAAMARCGLHLHNSNSNIGSASTSYGGTNVNVNANANGNTNGNQGVPRKERKLRDKQKKALVVVQDLMKRSGGGGGNINADELLYAPICTFLRERAKMRSQWREREEDWVFQSMPDDYKPLPVPFQFNVDVNVNVNANANANANANVANSSIKKGRGKKEDKDNEMVEWGMSPLPGSSEDLIRLSDNLKECSRAYLSQNESDLPKMTTIRDATVQKETRLSKQGSSPTNGKEASVNGENVEGDGLAIANGQTKGDTSTQTIRSKQIVFKTSEKLKNEEESESESKSKETHHDKQEEGDANTNTNTNTDKITSIERPIATMAPEEHQKQPNWKGWKSIPIGLEMQEPWAGLLLNGTKCIETRAYDIPKALVGKKIDILQSKRGTDGSSSLPNVMDGKEIAKLSLKRVGWCIFEKVIVYRYKAKFDADKDQHLVDPQSNYGWKADTKAVYGWVVSKYGRYKGGGGKKAPKEMKCIVRRMRSLFELRT